jgi:potassium channel subfamily K, other eukaryote
MVDLINIVAVTVFGVQHRFDDGFTYGQSFWMTVCSTIASSFTNATLIWDLCRTPDFNQSGGHILVLVDHT